MPLRTCEKSGGEPGNTVPRCFQWNAQPVLPQRSTTLRHTRAEGATHRFMALSIGSSSPPVIYDTNHPGLLRIPLRFVADHVALPTLTIARFYRHCCGVAVPYPQGPHQHPSPSPKAAIPGAPSPSPEPLKIQRQLTPPNACLNAS